jgi:DNA-binding transcriptional MerR regulator
MTSQAPPSGQQLISLGKASNLLGVNQITLRLWADKGLVRVFRTAGGHRRFAKDDLVHLMQEQVSPAQSGDLAERAVRGFRRHLKSRKAARPGLNSMNGDSREHLRVLGRRLVEVAIRYHREKRNRPTLLEEARVIGRDYAAENQKLGYTLTEAVEFFLSHRNRFVEIVQNLLSPDVSRDETLRLLRDMAVLSDAVMLALIAGYQKIGVVPSPHRNSSA